MCSLFDRQMTVSEVIVGLSYISPWLESFFTIKFLGRSKEKSSLVAVYFHQPKMSATEHNYNIT